MDIFTLLPVWGLFLIILLLRVCDVSLGTMRMITVVQGRVTFSVFLGFLEILIWVAVISQVIAHITKHPILGLAYALGFATGNAVGIMLERRMALGSCVVRIISSDSGQEISQRLRELGQRVTTFNGEGRDGIRVLIYATCERRDLKTILTAAKEIDPKIFYVVERVLESSHIDLLTERSLWRAIVKKK